MVSSGGGGGEGEGRLKKVIEKNICDVGGFLEMKRFK